MRKHDPALYREMSEPFATTDEANAALSAFFDELYELRRKHRLADVHCVVAVSTVDTGERELFGRVHIGDEHRAEMMTAYAFASAQASHERHIASVMRIASRNDEASA